jgi:hypothetical protein
MRRSVFAVLLYSHVAILGLVGTSMARATAVVLARDLNVEARASIAQAVFAASSTQAAAEKAADARFAQMRGQIDALRVQRDAALAKGAAARVEAAQTQVALTAAQERFVADLAERDRAYAQEIAVFRNAVTDIAATPEGEAALRRFNAGDEPVALAILDRLRAANDRARRFAATSRAPPRAAASPPWPSTHGREASLGPAR